MLLTLAIILAIILGIISSLRWRRFNFVPISPTTAYAMIWGFVWLIHLSDIFHYFSLSDRAILFSILPLIFIFIGEQIGGAKWKIHPTSLHILHKRRLFKLAVFTCYLLVFLSVIFFATVYTMFGPPWKIGIGTGIKFVRVTEGVSGLAKGPFSGVVQLMGVFNGLFYVILFLAVPIFVLNRRVGTYCLLASPICAVLIDFSLQSRTFSLDVGIIALISFIIWSKILKLQRSDLKRKFKKYLVIMTTIVLISALLYIGVVITKARSGNRAAVVGDTEVPYGIYQLLTYYTATLTAFDQTLDDNPPTYGGVSFGGILSCLKKLNRLGIETPDFDVYEIWNKWEFEGPMVSHQIVDCNAYTWLRYLYSDFGIYGLIFVPFIVGFLGAFFAKRADLSSAEGFFSYVWLSYCYYIVFRSPLLFPFRLDYIVIGLVIIIFTKYYVSFSKGSIRRRSPKAAGNLNSMATLGNFKK
jgi:oligosaccharide repeat unit polymerase